ncbi:DUF2283 domain-containing protein [Fervidibacter sacchari]
MTLHYDRETDMLVIVFRDKPSVESEEIAQGVVLDFDDEGNIVGMEIEDASKRVDLNKLEIAQLPLNALLATLP